MSMTERLSENSRQGLEGLQAAFCPEPIGTKYNNTSWFTALLDAESRKNNTYYVYNALGQLAVEYSNDTTVTTGVSYLFTDMLGSVRTITNASGNVTECFDYLPFGRILGSGDNGRSVAGCHLTVPTNVANSAVSEKFTGQPRDAETGLDYFGARYFSAPLGRFTSPDPLMASAKTSNPQSWNRYTYAFNNPLRFVDPDGMEVPDECVDDPTCEIEVSLNVIYDKNAFGKKGLTKAQKKKFEAEQLEKAKEDFGVSNITLKVSYSEGEYDKSRNSFSGFNADALNVVATDFKPKDKIGAAGLDKENKIPYIMINSGEAVVKNTFFGANTTEHELGHQFLGHVYNGITFPLLQNLYYDALVNPRLYNQSQGAFQQSFREGLAPRRYAVPANPEANKPRQE